MIQGGCSLPLHVDRCHTVANLEGLQAGLDDRGKDRFTLVGVCKHIRDLVQEAREERDRSMAWSLHLTVTWLEVDSSTLFGCTWQCLVEMYMHINNTDSVFCLSHALFFLLKKKTILKYYYNIKIFDWSPVNLHTKLNSFPSSDVKINISFV